MFFAAVFVKVILCQAAHRHKVVNSCQGTDFAGALAKMLKLFLDISKITVLYYNIAYRKLQRNF